MSHYDKSFVDQIIRERAKARRERAERRTVNPFASRLYVPFEEYLRLAHGIDDWHTVRRYKLWELFNDYQCVCASVHLEWESPTKYGLYNTLL